jgi:hypothetical protein
MEIKTDKGKKLLVLLNTLDERVRFATVEVLLAQDSSEVAKELERFITDSSAENTRLHQVVVDAFVEKGWVTQLDLPEGTQVAPGIVFKSDKRLRKG